MKSTKEYQHKLIVLISTLSYINSKSKQYTQSNILYYFNNNMKKNDQKEVKLKTLQSYLYKLSKILGVTINYHRHLGVNMGTEIHYKLKYNKKKCYRIINKYFKEKKEERHKNRVNSYFKKNYNKNSSVEKWECYNNINNKIEERQKNAKYIEELQIEKYAKKCHFRSNAFLSILNLEVGKFFKIEALKAIKVAENNIHRKTDNTRTISKLKFKQKQLNKILDKTKTNLKNEGYESKQLTVQIQKIYEKYKHKPHFIIENDKYNDLAKEIENLRKIVEYTKKNKKEDKKNIRDNVFSILLEQLKHKVDISILIPILKNYLNEQNRLEYCKVINKHYYYELLRTISNNKDYLRSVKSDKVTS
ncbi:hypothetical protein bcCo53_001471 (plasmid) [Borrelia coriaceae]|uniref:Uncharacterized protein n=1 Tax=Borrelia coriaceae ATCC 43381 TaxID=1408429 RepID=W5SXP8_9SPIR|nr:plasmid maintenance protein [Borrelia coriaceae]AHH11463.1 Hypothetical protein BCO_0129702 [Borrelia coriaceae ATCC 43381]UPA17292.1 hypothetical protein bcCo53_001471 [Borrelia coriaceae]